jgi:hypothetical protein
MSTVQTRGKSFSIPGGGPSLLSVAVPGLLDFIDQTKINGPNSIVNIMIKSSSTYDVKLRDYTTGNWTDSDTIIVSGSYAVFSISGVNVMDIELTPSSDPGNFYVYVSGEIN